MDKSHPRYPANMLCNCSLSAALLLTTFLMPTPILPPETDGFKMTDVPKVSKRWSILSSFESILSHLAVGTKALSNACFMGILEVVMV